MLHLLFIIILIIIVIFFTGKINFINIQYLSNQLYPKMLFPYIINIKIRGIFIFLVSSSLNFMCILLTRCSAATWGYSTGLQRQ